MSSQTDKKSTDLEDSNDDLVLETQGITKQFGGLTAVDDINFKLPTGELRCLIGPNGAGKSTFLKLITGSHLPTEGAIIYQGRDITSLEPYERARKGISLKFQQISTYQNLTVEQNLRIPVQLHNPKGKLEERISEMLDLINLREKRTLPADSLSHGEQQWLEIAMAMSTEPQLLLLDEPTAGMTIDETRETGKLIQDLAREGMSILVVEHDVNLVRQIADRVTVLHNGSIFTEGSVEDVIKHEGVKRIYLGKSAEETQ